MTPIISPWVFYWMYVCDNVSSLIRALAIAAIVVLVVTVAITLGAWAANETMSAKRAGGILVKRVIPIGCALWLAASLFPDKATLTQMVVAQNVTYERVEGAADIVQTVYEDIISLFEEDANEN